MVDIFWELRQRQDYKANEAELSAIFQLQVQRSSDSSYINGTLNPNLQTIKKFI
jgi:hypothetical protein